MILIEVALKAASTLERLKLERHELDQSYKRTIRNNIEAAVVAKSLINKKIQSNVERQVSASLF